MATQMTAALFKVKKFNFGVVSSIAWVHMTLHKKAHEWYFESQSREKRSR